jgi:hypothetical protein
MLEEAGLKQDVVGLALRSTGKALITFTLYASVCKCIDYFHGYTWSDSKLPTIAIYVRIVARGKADVQGELPKVIVKEDAPKMSASAPAFVPASLHMASDTIAHKLAVSSNVVMSADAPCFEPQSILSDDTWNKNANDPFWSDASTEVGPVSD